MRVQPVDPRDTRWEVDHPAYRVYFWQQGSRPGAGWTGEEWQTEGADVQEVLTWADADELRRPYIVYVCCERDGVPGLIRLCGTDPTVQR
jgi:hypothetical protein